MANLPSTPAPNPVSRMAAPNPVIDALRELRVLTAWQARPGVDPRALLALEADTIGHHPAHVVKEARRHVGARGFYPSPNQFLEALLAAYAGLGEPLSPDAERYVKTRDYVASDRYQIDRDGHQTFRPDAKLATISFNSVAGVHANTILKRLPDATPTDVDEALLSVSRWAASMGGASLGAIIDRCEELVKLQIDARSPGYEERQVARRAEIKRRDAHQRLWGRVTDCVCDAQSISDVEAHIDALGLEEDARAQGYTRADMLQWARDFRVRAQLPPLIEEAVT